MTPERKQQPSRLRTVLGWGVGIPFTMLVSLGVLFHFGFTRNPEAVHRAARFWGRTVLRICGIGVNVTGQENLVPEVLPAIIVANHQGIFDIFALSGYLPVRFAWIAKSTLFRIPLLGPAMLRAGYIPIERSHRENAHRSIRTASLSLRDHSVVIFPEGTRTRTGSVGPFKRGASYLAMQTGSPIVPVTITGSWQCLPRNDWRISPGIIHIQIDPAISTESKSKDVIDQELSAVRDRMIERVSAYSGSTLSPVNRA